MSKEEGKMKTISKYHSSVSRKGLDIMCPKCGQGSTVYHLAWNTSICQRCGKEVKKTEYIKREV